MTKKRIPWPRKERKKNIDYVHVLEDVPIWWHDILLVIGIFAQQAINKDIISLFFWKTHGPFLLVVITAMSDSSVGSTTTPILGRATKKT